MPLVLGMCGDNREHHWQTGRDTGMLPLFLRLLSFVFASKCVRKVQSRRCLNDHLTTREMSQSCIFYFDSGKWKSTVLHDFRFTELASVVMWLHNTGKRQPSLSLGACKRHWIFQFWRTTSYPSQKLHVGEVEEKDLVRKEDFPFCCLICWE